MAADRVRLRFHATAPDGRQVGPVDVEALVAPFVRLVHVTRVSFASPGLLAWDTDAFPVSYGQPEPALKIDGNSPISTHQLGPGDIACGYDFDVEVGMAWSIDTQPEVLYSDIPFKVPQHGIVS